MRWTGKEGNSHMNLRTATKKEGRTWIEKNSLIESSSYLYISVPLSHCPLYSLPMYVWVYKSSFNLWQDQQVQSCFNQLTLLLPAATNIVTDQSKLRWQRSRRQRRQWQRSANKFKRQFAQFHHQLHVQQSCVSMQRIPKTERDSDWMTELGERIEAQDPQLALPASSAVDLHFVARAHICAATTAAYYSIKRTRGQTNGQSRVDKRVQRVKGHCVYAASCNLSTAQTDPLTQFLYVTSLCHCLCPYLCLCWLCSASAAALFVSI